jgi:hypothetical protein
MNKLVFAVALLLIVPVMRAQQAETKDNPPQAAPQVEPQPAPQNPNGQDKQGKQQATPQSEDTPTPTKGKARK